MITQKEMILDFIRSKDFVAKLACLVLAVFLWYIVGNKNDNEMRYKIKVDIANLPEDQVVTDIEKRYVGVTVRGESEDLENIDKRKLSVSVDLSNTIVGKPYLYDLNLDYTDVPEAVNITLDEKKLFVTVDQKISKTLFVKTNISGKVAPGYIRGNVTIEPERVVIFGSSEMIQKIAFIETMDFSINSITSTLITDVPLDTRRLDFSNISTDTVTVRVEVFESEGVYIYEPDIEHYGLMENFSYDFSDTTCSVFVQSNTGEKPEISANDVKAWIDLDSVYASDFMTETGKKLAEIRRKASVKAMINKKSDDFQIITVVPDHIIIRIQQ